MEENMGHPWATAMQLVHGTNRGDTSSEKEVVGKMRDPETLSYPKNLQGIWRQKCCHCIRMELNNFIGSRNKYFV